MTPTNAGLRWTVLLIAVAGALGTAACGSEQRRSPASPENAEQRQAYAACLAQNGVQLPERSGSGGERVKLDAEHPPPGVEQAAWDRARQACAGLAPPRRKNG
ncbi:hypothetical protein GCM10023321_78450 [Pseudonocardia eucalypti]|uniref:Lipoprotein n=1 Tax=Pseudonocardia eucalypti TaxID=648755 RepID=A0ABP9RBA7_9PSEU|nr:hypothetical protein [Pseudonocardia eucalypti]